MGKKSTSKLGSKESKSTADGSKGNAKLNATWNHEAHIKYRLSDKGFVTLGWTKLPQDVVILKMTTYKTFPSKPRMLFFKRRPHTEHKRYPDGSRAAVMKADGTGSIYYPNGKVAIRYQNKTYIVVSPGGKDPTTGEMRGPVISALFDLLGNGVVYNNDGNVVLNFTQRQGVLVGTQNGLPMMWSWPLKVKQDESLTVPESQKCYFLDESTNNGKEENGSTVPNIKSSNQDGVYVRSSVKVLKLSESEGRRERKEKLKEGNKLTALSDSKSHQTSGEVQRVQEESNQNHPKNSLADQNPVEALEEDEDSLHSEELDYSAYKTCLQAIKNTQYRTVCAPIKPILKRLNKYTSLRIQDQANVSLTFSACGLIFRLEVGVVVDPSVVAKVNRVIMKEAISVNGVVNYFEQFPNPVLQSVLNQLTRQRDWSMERLKERQRILKRCGGYI